MSVSTLNFSATLPPFTHTSGYNTNFSGTNLSATGSVALNTIQDNATGATTTTVTSSVTSNGIDFVENNATINGNLLTVNYTANATSQNVSSLENNGINGTGVDFTPQASTTNGNSITTSYATNPNSHFDLTISDAAISTGTAANNQSIILKSLAVVGNSLTATYQLTNDIPNNVTLAPSAPPSSITVKATTNSAVNLAATGATFASTGLSTIGDVLAASTGINFYGTPQGSFASAAPQGGQQTGFSASNATLAATLNPNLDTSPSTSFSIGDFISTGLSDNAPATNLSASSGDNASSGPFSGTNTTGGPFAATTGTTISDQTNTDSFIAANASIGVYNAIANASASTIRGVGVNTVA
jgi:hypothetical protein